MDAQKGTELFEVPKLDQKLNSFRPIFWALVAFMLGIAFVSLSQPDWLQGRTQQMFKWAGLAMPFVTIFAVMALGMFRGQLAVRKSLNFELAGEKIIQRRDGGQTIEIDLANVTKVVSRRNWLIVRQDFPLRQITIPFETIGFDDLKSRIVHYHPEELENKDNPFTKFIPLAVYLAAWALLLLVQDRRMILLAGGLALGLQMWGISIVMSLMKRKGTASSKFLLPIYVLSMFLVGWIVYVRFQSID